MKKPESFRRKWCLPSAKHGMGSPAAGGSYASEMRALLSVQVDLIHHYLGKMDDDCRARALRTLKWIDEQMSRLPETHYAEEALMTY